MAERGGIPVGRVVPHNFSMDYQGGLSEGQDGWTDLSCVDMSSAPKRRNDYPKLATPSFTT